MSILRRFTLAALKENRTRTWVTIIGIVMSMALLTAVIEGAYSGLVYMRGVTIEDIGRYHAYFRTLDPETAETVKDQDFTDVVTATWRFVGYEKQEPDALRQPLFVDALTDTAPMVAERIVEGRMPENDREIILPSRFMTLPRGAAKDFAVGSTVTLELGTRTSPLGISLGEYDERWEDETVEDAVPATYTVVGVYDAFNYDVSGTGYRALTKGEGTGDVSVFFMVRNPYLFGRTMRSQTVSGDWKANGSLMRLYGSYGDSTLVGVLLGLTAVLVGLVMFGSVSLIYNAFAISVSERTRYFGILKSVGATKKQIRSSVRFEALALSAVGIPLGTLVGCAGIGITLWAVRDVFAQLVPGTETQMKLVLHPLALAAAALAALAAVLISAAVPAVRAARLQPIEAVRQSADVKIRPGDMKIPRITEKLFGFEGVLGARNFRRSRRSYRATVLSLFMSVVLFISASSLSTYLTDLVNSVAGTPSVDVYASVPLDAAAETAERMDATEEVTRSAYAYNFVPGWEGFQADPSLLTDACLEVPTHAERTDGSVDVPVSVIYLDDENFRSLCAASGVDPEPYFEKDCPYGVLVNSDITESVYGADRMMRYRYDMFRPGVLPASVTTDEVQERAGFRWEYRYDAESGREYVAYYPETYWKEQADAAVDGMYSVDPAFADEILPVEETLKPRRMSFDAFVQNDGFCLPTECACLVYPFSRIPEDRLEKPGETAGVFLKSGSHAVTVRKLSEYFEESGFGSEARAIDYAEQHENSRMIVFILNVFSYGFVILISLIAAANVFNTVSTSVMLRRREFAMLRSVGMTERSVRRMLSYECAICGAESLLFGLPVSVGVTYLIHGIVSAELQRGFYMPWHSIAVAVGSVFLVVFASMLYASGRLKRDNPIDALKNENL